MENREKIVGDNIRRMRERHGLTQDELADRLGIARAHLYRLENGIVSMRVRTLVRIAEMLEVHPSKLFVEKKKK